MDEDLDETRLLGGTLRLLQPRRSHRAGTDAVLLAAAVRVSPGERIVDIGSGVGTVGLALAARAPDIHITLVEREPSLAALARRNVALNGLADRAVVIEADVLADNKTASAGRFDVVVSNPPFFTDASVRLPKDARKARAYGLGGASHGDWLCAMLRWSRPSAQLLLIHRPDALQDLMIAAKGRLGSLRMRPVQPRDGQPARRILFGGIVGSRAPLSILPPLVLHGDGQGFTPMAEALHRGSDLLPLIEGRQTKRPALRPALSS